MEQRSHGPVVVVGGAGFIGGALCRRLAGQGVPVTAVTRSAPAIDQTGALHPALTGARTVYWAASSVNPLLAEQRPDLAAQDVDAFRAFLDALHARTRDVRVVLLSSGGTVYGSVTDPPHSEGSPPRPTSAYGHVKLRLEEVLHAHDVDSVVARISNAYGPGQSPAPGQGVIGHWLRALREDRPVTVFGDLGTVRDYVYIDDVVDLLVRLGDDGTVPGVLNAGSGVPTTLAAVVGAIGAVVGREPDVRYEPRRPFDVASSWLDVTAAERALGWRALTPLPDGIRAMWTWLCAPDGDAP